VTSTFNTQLTTENGVLQNASVIEVNFLFVPGNSGGTVFDALTGRVGGYVEGTGCHAVAPSQLLPPTHEKTAAPSDLAHGFPFE
jgi:hypothetical protein